MADKELPDVCGAKGWGFNTTRDCPRAVEYHISVDDDGWWLSCQHHLAPILFRLLGRGEEAVTVRKKSIC